MCVYIYRQSIYIYTVYIYIQYIYTVYIYTVYIYREYIYMYIYMCLYTHLRYMYRMRYLLPGLGCQFGLARFKVFLAFIWTLVTRQSCGLSWSKLACAVVCPLRLGSLIGICFFAGTSGGVRNACCDVLARLVCLENRRIPSGYLT